MNLVKLKDLCIFKRTKKDLRGFTYDAYYLAIITNESCSLYDFKIITGDKAGRYFKRIKKQNNLNGDQIPVEFKDFKAVNNIEYNGRTFYLQDIIKSALVEEQKYYACDNSYDFKKVKQIMKAFNKKIYENKLQAYKRKDVEMSFS